MINRLERICERLERAVSGRVLEITNEQLNTSLGAATAATSTDNNRNPNRNSDEIDNLPLPSLPTTPASSATITQSAPHDDSSATLELPPGEENYLRNNNNNNLDNYCDLATPTPPPPLTPASTDATIASEDLDLNIPTVIAQIENSIFLNEQSPADYTPPKTMSVYGFQDIVNGPLAQYLQLSAKIGGDVAKHADIVRKAFRYVNCSSVLPNLFYNWISTGLFVESMNAYSQINHRGIYFQRPIGLRNIGVDLLEAATGQAGGFPEANLGSYCGYSRVP